MKPKFLRPFWRYFGSKWRLAPEYPAPAHNTVIEPFAGAAGYALHHYERAVVLVEKNPQVAAAWRYLIGASGAELARIPCVEHVADLPSWVPEEGRTLVGFFMCAGDTRPRAHMSPMIRRDGPDVLFKRAAAQADLIKHWRIVEGDYRRSVSNLPATWFVDPPYQVAGARAKGTKDRGRVRYPNGADDIDFAALAGWCAGREGQVIVCENAGATWAPFTDLKTQSSVKPGGVSKEVVWLPSAA